VVSAHLPDMSVDSPRLDPGMPTPTTRTQRGSWAGAPQKAGCHRTCGRVGLAAASSGARGGTGPPPRGEGRSRPLGGLAPTCGSTGTPPPPGDPGPWWPFLRTLTSRGTWRRRTCKSMGGGPETMSPAVRPGPRARSRITLCPSGWTL
jgi:hypothetical protein